MGASAAEADYEISGIMGTPSYVRLEGVVVTLAGDAEMRDTTGSDGVYSFTGLETGDYVVTPALENWAFDPPSRVYAGLSADQKEQHFFGTQVEFSISGLVYSGLARPMDGVVLVLTGEAERRDTTGADGRYAFADLPAGGYELIPEFPGWAFEPASRTYTLAADMGNQTFRGLPVQGYVKVLGGENGYVDAARGEKATLVVNSPVAGSVRFIVYTLRGEWVVDGRWQVEAGAECSFEWECRNRSGELVAPGIYIIEVDGTGINFAGKIAVVR